MLARMAASTSLAPRSLSAASQGLDSKPRLADEVAVSVAVFAEFFVATEVPRFKVHRQSTTPRLVRIELLPESHTPIPCTEHHRRTPWYAGPNPQPPFDCSPAPSSNNRKYGSNRNRLLRACPVISVSNPIATSRLTTPFAPAGVMSSHSRTVATETIG